MNSKAGMKFDCIFEETLDFIDIEYTHLNKTVRYKAQPHGEWIPCSDMLPKENICDDGYIEPSDYVLVFGDKGDYGVSRYWGNRISKKENPNSFSDWMGLDWHVEKPIAWMPLPEPYKEEGEQK